MAVTSVNRKSQRGSKQLHRGIVEYSVDEIWQINTDDETDGVFEVMSPGTGLPELGQTFVAGDGSGVILYVDRQGPPVRQKEHLSKKLWNCPVHYTSRTDNQDEDLPPDPTGGHVQNPTDTPQQVQFAYLQEFEDIHSTLFLGAEMRLAGEEGVTQVLSPPYLPQFSHGPIVNSSGEMILNAKRRKAIPTYRVSRIVDTWPDEWDDLLNTRNDAPVTITQEDINGIRWQKTYQGGSQSELLLANILKRDLWIRNQLFFQATFVIHVDKVDYHDHVVPDYGTHIRIFAGGSAVAQRKTNVDQTDHWYTGNEVDKMQTTLQPVPSGEGEFASGHMSKLNGYGNVVPRRRPMPGGADTHYDSDNASFFLRFLKYPAEDWTSLGIT